MAVEQLVPIRVHGDQDKSVDRRNNKQMVVIVYKSRRLTPGGVSFEPRVVRENLQAICKPLLHFPFGFILENKLSAALVSADHTFADAEDIGRVESVLVEKSQVTEDVFYLLGILDHRMHLADQAWFPAGTGDVTVHQAGNVEDALD